MPEVMRKSLTVHVARISNRTSVPVRTVVSLGLTAALITGSVAPAVADPSSRSFYHRLPIERKAEA